MFSCVSRNNNNTIARPGQKATILKNVIIKVINRVATYFYNIFHRIAEDEEKKVTCKYVDLCLFIDTTQQRAKNSKKNNIVSEQQLKK